MIFIAKRGAQYTLTEHMPRWMGCFIHQGGTEVLKRAINSYTRPAPLWIGTTETAMLAGTVVTVERQEIEGEKPRYSAVEVGEESEAGGGMFE